MARIKKISIRNILGIEELEIEPGTVTHIEGGNGVGKSSILEAIKSVVDGGHDATLLRQGEESGEIVLLLDDGVEIRESVRENKTERKVKSPEHGMLGAPKTYIDGITDPVAVNPVRFLTSNDRVEILLEAMPAEIDTEELRAALEDAEETGEVDVGALTSEVEGMHALEAISIAHRRVYDARTGVNRLVKEAETTAKTLTESLPAEGASVEEVESELEEAAKAHREADMSLSNAAQKIDADLSEETERIRSEAASEVEALQAQIQEVKDEAQAEVEAYREEAKEKKAAIEGEKGPEVEDLAGRVAALRERLDTVKDAERTRTRIDAFEAQVADEGAKSEALTDTLSRLDGLKEKMLEDLPIEGAEIIDGELVVGGIPFDRLNSAKKAEIAVEVARMRAGDLGLVCVDNMELLDPDTFGAFTDRLSESDDLHAFVTRVTSGALSVTTDKETT